MSKINVSGWKEFKVGELFDIKGTKSLDVGHVTLTDDGDCQFIGRTNDNNGVQGNINSSTIDFDPNESNNITVSQVGTITAQYRDHPYYTSQNILKLSMDNLSKNIALFFCGLINGRLRALGFVGYNTLKMNDLKNLTIKLPVTSTGEPDWDYMDEYIEKLATQARKNVSSLATLKPIEHKIDIKAWKEFKIGKLFDVDTGVSVPKLDLDANPGNTPRISVTNENNGVIGYYDDKADLPNIRYFTNFISVNFFGKAFYHPGKASVEMKVHVLKLKNREFTPKLALFFTSVLNKYFSKDNYGYGNQLSSSKLKSSMYQIPLPVTSTGQPDFDYMEKYIDNVQNEAHESLELLKQI